VASIFAWTRGFAHRAKLDNNELLQHFSNTLEKAVIDTIERGHMTKDLAICVHGNNVKEGTHYLITEAFMDKIDEDFQGKWKKIVG
jgi:isocitrate dehydrogenase